jgi:hypothetical protein
MASFGSLLQENSPLRSDHCVLNTSVLVELRLAFSQFTHFRVAVTVSKDRIHMESAIYEILLINGSIPKVKEMPLLSDVFSNRCDVLRRGLLILTLKR